MILQRLRSGITIVSIIMLLLAVIIPSFQSVLSLEKTGLLYRQGKYDEAADRLQNLDVIDEKERERHLAYLQLEMGNYEKYTEHLERAGAIDKDNTDLKLEIAAANFRTGKYSRAAEIIEELKNRIDDDPGAFETIKQRKIYYYHGKILLALEDLEGARKSWERGLQVDEKSKFYRALADLERAEENYDRASELYLEALEMDSSLTHLYIELAEIFEKMGKEEKAYNYWLQVRDTGIITEEAQEHLRRLKVEYPHLIEKQFEIEEPEKPFQPWEPEFEEVEEFSFPGESPQLNIKIGQKHNRLKLQSDEDFLLRTKDGNVLNRGEAGQTWKIDRQEGKFVLKNTNSTGKKISVPDHAGIWLSAFADNSSFVLRNVSFGQDYYWAGSEDRQYRGDIYIYPEGEEKFIAVNRVGLEEYLLSVVPSEMPSYWPQEALKSQAVAMRSYALHNKENRHSNPRYDLCDSVHCAVYSGVQAEASPASSAVLDTAGEVGKASGEVIEAVFSSNSGGITHDAADVWGYDIDYLQGVDLHQEDTSFKTFLPAQKRDWVKGNPDTFSRPENYGTTESYRWSRRYNIDILEKQLDMEEIEEIKIAARSGRGYVKALEISGEHETRIIESDEIRSALGGLRSNIFILFQVQSPRGKLQEIVIYGAGWGHGVGMDQTAAANMAAENMDYREIFTVFFDGSEIKNLY